MGGPSRQAKDNAAAQAAFYRETTAQQKAVFGEHQRLFDEITAMELPILRKGPLQYGFTPEVDALLRQDIIDRAAQAEASAVTGTQLRERQRGGGTNVLPTGAEAEEEEIARVLTEQTKARQLSQEKLAGFQTGGQLYAQALGALSGQQQLINPTAYTSAATGAGRAATGAIQLADSERSKLLSTLLGGAIKGGLTLATGGAAGMIPNYTPLGG